MLVLKRKTNEKVIVTIPPSTQPQTISIMVVECRPVSTRLGIDGPRDITIHREEVQRRVEQEIKNSPVRIWNQAKLHQSKSPQSNNEGQQS